MEESSISPRRLQTHEIRYLTIEQIKQLLEAAQEHTLRALLTTAITTGMRRGELLGLHWSDIDAQNEILRVHRIVSENGEKEVTGTARTLALPVIALRALQEHQKDQKKEQGETWQDLGLVFADTFGQYYRSSKLRQMYQATFDAIEQSHLYFHNLRHSTVACFIEMRVNIAIIRAILGLRQQHTVVKTLTPVSLSMQKEAMKQWDHFLAK